MHATLMTDPSLPTLPGALDAATIGVHLQRAVARDRVRDVQFQILKYHPASRCTFEIAFRTDSGAATVIGKVYASDRRDVFDAMQAIQRCGFGPHEELSIPQPLAYVSELRLLLQEKVDGPRAKLVFLDGVDGDRADAAARAARWLAQYHAAGPVAGRAAPASELLDAAERWARRIAQLGEPFASRAQQLARRLLDHAAAHRPAHLCAGHGSFNSHQIIIGDGRTVTFDWDGYDVADPCRDTARFVVALQRLAVKYYADLRALDAAVDVFLTTYQRHSPHDITRNLAWYRALTCLLLAKYEANRLDCPFPEGITALLNEGLRVLEEKTSDYRAG